MTPKNRITLFVLTFSITASILQIGNAQQVTKKKSDVQLFDKKNLVAWCIVPFDKKKRGPAQRAQMLKNLGITQLAYDYRKEHIPTFDEELNQLKKNGIQLTAWWFPGVLNDEAKMTLELFKRHGVHPQLWITGSGKIPQNDEEQQEQVAAEAERIRPIAEAAREAGCKVALYNHGGWFGNPRNQIAIIKKLNMPNVGIVYNLHHGHDHLKDFHSLLAEMKPYLLALNLNGMNVEGDRKGQKILPIAAGSEDLKLLKIIQESGWKGPVGILNHTQEDAELRLKDNLNGLTYLVSQLEGKKNLPLPKYVSYAPEKKDPKNESGFLAKGLREYQVPPLTAECRVKLDNANSYNILLANDTKSSPNHWEIFSLPGSGNLTVYLPGKQPDHVHTSRSITDRKWHTITMQFHPDRIRLYVDGKQVADAPVKFSYQPSEPDEFAIGRLVEGKLFSKGTYEWVHLKKGIHSPEMSDSPEATPETIALWRIDSSNLNKELRDFSPLNNPIKRSLEVSERKPELQSPMPPPGVHHILKDERLQASLIDRSRDDVFMAVKVDSENRVFVGGSKAVFVYEPKADGGYEPKKLLYEFPKDSIIMGLEFRGNDLYVLADHALYLIPEGRVNRENLKVKRLLWGIPLDLHVSFHSMAWGPDGKLYLNHGDPLLGFGDWNRPDHWAYWTLHTQPEGTTVPYTGAGAVLKINPDGLDLEVIARGLRGPVGLVFDDRFNLFTNDNDHESRPDQYAPARLLHVTDHADFFWPRGWMAEKSPDRFDLLETMIPSLGRGVPCDMVFYDENYLPEEYRKQLFLCRWGRFSANRFEIENRGASFSAKESVLLEGQENARPTGIAIGPDGRIYVTSLYLAGNVAAPYCPTDLISVSRKDQSPNQEAIFDVTNVSEEKLYSELKQPSLYRRNRAHQELIRRGQESLQKAVELLNNSDTSDPSVPHLIWLAALSQQPEAVAILEKFASGSNQDIRLQALKAITRFHPEKLEVMIPKLLEDSDPQIQLTGLTRLIDNPDVPFSIDQVAELASSTDSYLRQAATFLLARSKRIPIEGSKKSLQSLVRHPSADFRLAGILAAGTRLTVPSADNVPDQRIKLTTRTESVFYKETIQFADSSEKIRLTDFGPVGSYSIASRWNSIPHSSEEIQLKDLLISALDDSSTRNRLQAAYYLSLLNDAEINPLVEKAQNKSILEQFASQTVQSVREIWSLGPIPNHQDGFHRPVPPENEAIDLTREFRNSTGTVKWTKTAATDESFQFLSTGNPQSSQFVYFQFQSPEKTPILLHLKTKMPFKAFHNGRPIRMKISQADQNLHLFKFDVFPGSNDILIRLKNVNDSGKTQIDFRTMANVTLTLPEQLSSSMLAQRLSEAAGAGDNVKLSKEFFTRDWNSEFKKGDRSNGRKLFGTLGCAKCHAITDGQPGGGAPSLTGASRRFTISHLVESILIPNKKIAEQFQSSTIMTEDGKIFSGLVTTETENELEILLSDASRKRIPRSEIEEQKISNLSTMPSGIIKTPEELRDLLSYLMSDNPTPP